MPPRYVLGWILSDEVAKVIVKLIHEYLNTVSEYFCEGKVKLDDFIVFKASGHESNTTVGGNFCEGKVKLDEFIVFKASGHEYLTTIGENFCECKVKLDDFIVFKATSSPIAWTQTHRSPLAIWQEPGRLP